MTYQTGCCWGTTSTLILENLPSRSSPLLVQDPCSQHSMLFGLLLTVCALLFREQTTCINWRTSGHNWNQIRCTPCLNGRPCWIHANKNRLGDKKDLAIYAYEYYYIPRLMVPPSLFIILNCEWEEYWSKPNGQVNNGKLPSANDNLLLENTELSL